MAFILWDNFVGIFEPPQAKGFPKRLLFWMFVKLESTVFPPRIMGRGRRSVKPNESWEDLGEMKEEQRSRCRKTVKKKVGIEILAGKDRGSDGARSALVDGFRMRAAGVRIVTKWIFDWIHTGTK